MLSIMFQLFEGYKVIILNVRFKIKSFSKYRVQNAVLFQITTFRIKFYSKSKLIKFHQNEEFRRRRLCF